MLASSPSKFSETSAKAKSSFFKASSGVLFVFGLVGLMWLFEGIDWLSGGALEQHGLHSRGNFFPDAWVAPLLHGNFAHLIGNSIPLLILGVIIAAAGLWRIIALTLIVATVSGFGIWAFSAPNVNTIGASGLVFGFAAFLLVRGIFTRNLIHIFIGVGVGFIYGSMLMTGLEFHDGISWTAHAFGALGGIISAKVLGAKKTDKVVDASTPRI